MNSRAKAHGVEPGTAEGFETLVRRNTPWAGVRVGERHTEGRDSAERRAPFFNSRIDHNPSIEAGHAGRTVAMNGPAFFETQTHSNTPYTE